ncbi:right-handed parallel beta-helix repeat-containing protein [Flaviaesturariibacter amylovorans]|uniref:Right-handed parallel beta-helix repeat-containing protein n=1 Tax=Flaviaesturariibacter amylovorans TaxID=1084520 RepID=A0ABP8H564_9BACT
MRAALERAAAGDTIYLHPGTYREGNIVIRKPISVFGVGGPILDGEGKYEQLTLSGNAIRIRGLRFRRTGYSSMNDNAAIGVIDARNVLIEENVIENGYFAIHCANTHMGVIRKNVVLGNARTEQTSGNGIHLWKCSNMLVEKNQVSGHRDGIYFEFVTHSVIRDNSSRGNIRYGLHFMFSNNDTYLDNDFGLNGAGVAVMYSHHVLMQGNRFQQNWGPSAYGLLLKEISDAEILKNHFADNTAAILMESTNRIQVWGNVFRSNGWALRISASCNENAVHHNNFFANTFDVATNGSLMLNRFYCNYWDKYDGYDRNRDGYGDVPYHPVSLYSMVIEQNPQAVILMRSFMVTLLDKAEKAVPSLTPEQMADDRPLLKSLPL